MSPYYPPKATVKEMRHAMQLTRRTRVRTSDGRIGKVWTATEGNPPRGRLRMVMTDEGKVLGPYHVTQLEVI